MILQRLRVDVFLLTAVFLAVPLFNVSGQAPTSERQLPERQASERQPPKTQLPKDQPPPAEDEVPLVTGKVSSVVLHRESALVTREVTVQGDATEIIVDGLPEQLQASTVFAEGGEGVTIRGVRVVTIPTEVSSRQDVAELDERIESLQNEMSGLRGRINVIEKQMNTLDRMVNFSHSSSESDLNRGVLDADALMSIVEYSGEQRMHMEESKLEIQRELELASRRVIQLNREKTQLAGNTPKRRYQARVFLQRAPGKIATFRLRYAVSGCTWSPQYSVEAKTGGDAVHIRYGAVIKQTSGEAWNGVQLTLSTASPSVRARGPILVPLKVTTRGATDASGNMVFGEDESVDDLFGDPFGGSSGNDMPQQSAPNQGAAMPSQSIRSKSYQGKIKSLRKQQIQAENSPAGDTPFTSNMGRDSMMNRYAGEMQALELEVTNKAAGKVSADEEIEVASQTYALKSPVTLDSRRDQQLVDIADLNLKGEFAFVATPLLSSYVYRQITVRNDSETALLQGPATIYLDDRFVGGMEMPSTAVGQQLIVGLGADNQIRTRRELLNKTDTVQGGNRRIEFRYRLVLNNFKPDGVRVRVMDRVPNAKDDREIKLELGETSVPLSHNDLYQRVERPMGILRFDVDLPQGAAGGNALDVTYAYVIELDRNEQIVVPNVADQAITGIQQRIIGGGGLGGGMGR